VGDITYLPKQGGGWLYLATWLDRYSRKIMGWDVREPCPKTWSTRPYAAPWRCVSPRLGSSCTPTKAATAVNFEDLVARKQAIQSMSRRGNCYDNAHAESF
jgi:transposase InsO family protein